MFLRNEKRPLCADAVIIDEASMVDIILMYHLLKAIPKEAALILVGDAEQLPSVGPGNVLGDVIRSRAIPVSELDHVFRQAKKSSIVVNAHRIIRGQLPLTGASPDKIEDFYFIDQDDPEKVLALIVELVCARIPKRFGMDPMKDIQVLSPMHKGMVGTMNLNLVLQNALNPGDSGIQKGERSFRLRDKVMQLRNNYEKEVFNGDIGFISSVDREQQCVMVDYDGQETEYSFLELDEILPAYAVSVHKSQGSEYPAVVLPVLPQHYLLLQRNLIYTAITRGKRLVVVVGNRKAFAIGVRNDSSTARYTRLAERLRGGAAA
jgi:exodeoxyribonuclease V alpha subunit